MTFSAAARRSVIASGKKSLSSSGLSPTQAAAPPIPYVFRPRDVCLRAARQRGGGPPDPADRHAEGEPVYISVGAIVVILIIVVVLLLMRR